MAPHPRLNAIEGLLSDDAPTSSRSHASRRLRLRASSHRRNRGVQPADDVVEDSTVPTNTRWSPGQHPCNFSRSCFKPVKSLRRITLRNTKETPAS